MIKKNLIIFVASFTGLFLIVSVAFSAGPFYEGKTIRIIVGFSAGGGFDLYARTIARHMAKYIPGNPTIIVENMPGAGSLISANHLYRVAKPDGLTIGHFIGGLFFNQVLGQPGVEFDARKFEFIGSPLKDEVAYAFSKASGITSMEKWMASKTPVKMGGVGPGSYTPDNVIRIVKSALGLPIHLVSGYKGTADVRLAVESGELAGTSWGWVSMRATWRKALETGDVVVVLQGASKPFPDLPNVPLAINFAKTEEARQLIEVGIHHAGVFARPFVLPPGTPKERVKILAKAFQETLRDKEFIADVEKTRLDIDPLTDEELEKAVNSIFMLSPAMVKKLDEVFYK
ncbi:MAG: tripartite tricarboxylate transporter substrate-binding protein [Thermodesulfobacteriota bacterium]|nr:tripartite tricarboxylate transporter substrate-binding protein [Thermodesulfobacteriota bacterium]